MKIVILFPNPLAKALAEYVEKRQESVARERLNAVYWSVSEGVESAIQKAQLKVLDNDAW